MSLIPSSLLYGIHLTDSLLLLQPICINQLVKPLHLQIQGLTGKRPQKPMYSRRCSRAEKGGTKVEVEEGKILKISGNSSKEQEEKNDKWHRLERSSGKFLQRIRLPENAKVAEVKASLENGILTVTVPNVEEKQPEVKSIEISG